MKISKLRRNLRIQLRHAILIVLGAVNVYAVCTFISSWTSDHVEVNMFNDTPSSPYMGCHEFRPNPAFSLVFRGSHVTVELCLAKCADRNAYYALLQGGSKCYCSNIGGLGLVRMDSSCGAPCSGNKSQQCGSLTTASIYTVHIPDGSSHWTTWMTLEQSGLARRLRGCSRRRYMRSGMLWPSQAPTFTCLVSFETRKLLSTSVNVSWTKPFEDRYIGCFTASGFASASAVAVSNSLPEAIEGCIELCSKIGVTFAALLKPSGADRVCKCAPSLGGSLPIDTCTGGYGALVFSTVPLSSNGTVALRFEAERPQKKVLLLGYFRSGTTFASSLLNRYPHAFYTYEPDSLLGVKWKGIDSFGSAIAMNNVFAEKVLSNYFRCDMYRMPGFFLYWYPGWGEDNRGFESFAECKKKFRGHYGLAKCLPVLEESCRQSNLVVAKTTRFLAGSSVEAFVKGHPDIHVIHLVRDPRGTLASRQRVSSYYREDIEHHSRVLCKEIAAVNDLFKKLKDRHNLYTLYYEDLAIQPLTAAHGLYRSLGLEFLQEMKDHIQRVTSSNATHIRNYVFSIQRSDAAKHATSWKQHFKEEIIRAIDNQCQQLYDVFRGRYLAYVRGEES